MTPEVFWDLPESFWAYLPWTKDGHQILDLVERSFGKENVFIATCPTKSPASASGKMRWIQKNMPDYARRFIIGPPKWLCADKDTVLIDDALHNVGQFRDAGGRGILVPRLWNPRYNIHDVLGCIKNAIGFELNWKDQFKETPDV